MSFRFLSMLPLVACSMNSRILFQLRVEGLGMSFHLHYEIGMLRI
jgi:hypothetical protein